MLAEACDCSVSQFCVCCSLASIVISSPYLQQAERAISRRSCSAGSPRSRVSCSMLQLLADRFLKKARPHESGDAAWWLW